MNLEQCILRCSRLGDVHEFYRLLDNNGQDEVLHWRHARSGETLFLLVARYGHVSLLRALVEQYGENTEQRNSDGKRALHEIALGGHVESLRFLVGKNVEIDSLKRADWTPLMLSCTKSNLSIVKELISAGANPKLVNKDGWNSFHIAVREGHEEIIQFLLNICPDIWDTVSNNGRTPLHTAALHGHLQTVYTLLKCGSYTTDEADSCGITPLMDSFKGGFINVASLLITQHHSCVTARDKLGRQCVHIAAQSGSVPSLKCLVNDHHVDVNTSKDHTGMTPLHIAAKEGNIDAVMFLLNVGSEINERDINGRTALHLSSAAGQTGTVECLVEQQHVCVDIQDKNGLRAEDFALKKDVKQLFTARNNCEQLSSF